VANKKKKRQQPTAKSATPQKANRAKEPRNNGSGSSKKNDQPQPIKAAPLKPNKPLLYLTGGLFFLFLSYLFITAMLVNFG